MTDYAFFADFAAPPMSVVHLHCQAEMSRPFRLTLWLHIRDPNTTLSPQDTLGARCTLRIATRTTPACRSMHGVVLEAEELGATPHGLLYQLVVMPPLERARFRVQSRIFVEKTTRQIIASVLAADPQLSPGAAAAAQQPDLFDAYQPATERYEWRLADSPRIDDPQSRPYCVQYQESDLAFIARLLEEEGISYHFEHTGACVQLVFSDSDGGRMRLDPFAPLGPNVARRTLTQVRLGGRMRPRKVQLTAFDWRPRPPHRGGPCLQRPAAGARRRGAVNVEGGTTNISGGTVNVN